MKTNKKLNLTNLKVDSFITSIEKSKTNTVKGGTHPTFAASSNVCAASITTVSMLITKTIDIATKEDPKGQNNTIVQDDTGGATNLGGGIGTNGDVYSGDESSCVTLFEVNGAC